MKEVQYFKDFDKEINKLYKAIPLQKHERHFPHPDLLKKSKVMQILLTSLVLDQAQLDEFIKSHPKFKSMINKARSLMNTPKFIDAVKELNKKYPGQMVRIENVDFDSARRAITTTRLLNSETKIGECGINLSFFTSKPGGGLFDVVMWEVPINVPDEINPLKKIKALEFSLQSEETNIHVAKMLFMLYSENIEQCAIHISADLTNTTTEATKFIFSRLPDKSIVCVYDALKKSEELPGLLNPSFKLIMVFDSKSFDAKHTSWYESMLNKTADLSVCISNDSFNGWLNKDRDCLLQILAKKTGYCLRLSEDTSMKQQLSLVELLIKNGKNQVIRINVQKNQPKFYQSLRDKFPGYDIQNDPENGEISIDLRTPSKDLSHETSECLSALTI